MLASFCPIYRHIGTSPDGGSTYALPRLASAQQAMEIALLGEHFNAARALELGLVNRVVPQAELAATTQALAPELANGPTVALGRTRRLINEYQAMTLVAHWLRLVPLVLERSVRLGRPVISVTYNRFHANRFRRAMA